jgi:hypothetical protein
MARTVMPQGRRARELGAMLLVMYLLRALPALLLAWPVARLFGDVTLALPRGDRVLFDEGASYLVEVVRLYRPQLTSVAEGSMALWLLVAYLGLLPVAAWLALLTSEGPQDTITLAKRAARALGTLSLLLGIALLAGALALLLPTAFFGLLESKLAEHAGDVAYDLVHGGFRALSVLAVAVVLIVQDLARAAALRDDRGALSAAIAACRTFRAHWLSALGWWAAHATAGLALVALAALASAQIGVEGGVAFASVALLHQLVIMAMVCLRTHWLARSVRLLIPSASHAELEHVTAPAE